MPSLSSEMAHAFSALLWQCGRAAIGSPSQSDASVWTGWDPCRRSRQRVIVEYGTTLSPFSLFFFQQQPQNIYSTYTKQVFDIVRIFHLFIPEPFALPFIITFFEVSNKLCQATQHCTII